MYNLPFYADWLSPNPLQQAGINMCYRSQGACIFVPVTNLATNPHCHSTVQHLDWMWPPLCPLHHHETLPKNAAETNAKRKRTKSPVAKGDTEETDSVKVASRTYFGWCSGWDMLEKSLARNTCEKWWELWQWKRNHETAS